MKKVMLLVSALVLGVAAFASPGDKGLTYGTISHSVSVKGDFDRQTQTGVGFGTYLTDNLSVGVQGNFVPADTLRIGQVNAVANVDLAAIDATQETTPYIGVSVGVSDIQNHRLKDFKTDGQYGVQAGVRHAVSAKFDLYAEYAYKRSFQNVDHQNTVMVGLRYNNR